MGQLVPGARDSVRALRGQIALGPVLRHSRTQAAAGSPFAVQRPLGSGSLWQLGAQAGLPRRHELLAMLEKTAREGSPLLDLRAS